MPTKYRRVVIDEHVDATITEICLEISKRYSIYFLKIGADKDHLYLLVPSVPKMSPTEIVRTIKSITAIEVFRECPEVKKKLCGGEFWSDGYYVGMVGAHGSEKIIPNYVKNQRNEYNKIYQGSQVEGQMSQSDYM